MTERERKTEKEGREREKEGREREERETERRKMKEMYPYKDSDKHNSVLTKIIN